MDVEVEEALQLRHAHFSSKSMLGSLLRFDGLNKGRLVFDEILLTPSMRMKVEIKFRFRVDHPALHTRVADSDLAK